MSDYDLVCDQFFSKFSLNSYKKRSLVKSTEGSSVLVYYLKKGFMRVYRLSEQGVEFTLVILKPKEIFPYILGGNMMTSSYYLEAMTSVEVYVAPLDKFRVFLEDHPGIFFQLTNKVSNRLGGLLTRMEHLLLGNAFNKVATTLLICAKSLGEKQGENYLLSIPLTHRDIAALVGITRETACLEIKKLHQLGYIDYQGRQMVIKNIPKLETVSLLTSEEEGLLLGGY